MSNYPPTPSFGGPFNIPQQWPVSSSTPIHIPNSRPQMPSKPPVSNPPAAGVSNLVSQNTATFDTNSRLPLPGDGTSIPPPPHPSFFQHFANSSLPPPPYPPIPIPNLPFPPFPPPVPPQQRETPNIASEVATVVAPEVHTTDMSREHTSTETRDAREEGELSDGELDEATSASETVAARTGELSNDLEKSKDVQQAIPIGHQYQDPHGRSRHFLELSDNPREHSLPARQFDGAQDYLDQYDEIGDEVISEEEGSDTSYHPRSASPPFQASNVSRPFPPPEVSQVPSDLSQRTQTPGSLPINGSNPIIPLPSSRAIRERAKAALLSLAAHKIGLKEVAAEGINPTMLGDLYEELGLRSRVQIEPAPSAALPSTLPNIEEKAPPALTLHSQVPVKDVSQGSVNKLAKPKPNSEAKAGELCSTRSPDTTSKAAFTTASLTTPSVAPVSLTPATVDTTQKGEERKDRIARMLAAKTGKAVPVRSEVDKSDPSTTVVKGSASPRLPVTTSQSVPSSEVSAAQAKPKPDGQAKEKNKAQTELARQKMELLKKQALVKLQANKNSLDSSQAVSQPPQLGQYSSTHSAIVVPQTSEHTTDTSDSVPRIPGLFMTSSSVPGPQGSLGPAHLFQPSAPQQSPDNRISYKRPRAPDSNDSPATPAKRPFGRRESDDDDVRIVLSEDEMSEGFADLEDVKMYYDEVESDALEKSIDGLIKETSIQAANQRFTVFSDSTPQQPSSTTEGAIPSSASGQQTPGTRREQEDLRRKNEEILAMRKKIAEMEQRRKAKQAISRVQSPKTHSQSVIASGVATPTFINQSVSNIASTPARAVAPENGQTAVSANDMPASRFGTLSRSPLGRPESTRKTLSPEEVRRRIERRREIESGLPELDAKVSETQRELAELEEKARELKATLQKGLQGRKQLLMELEALGMDTEATPVASMTLSDLQDKRDELIEQQLQGDLPTQVDGPQPVPSPSSVPPVSKSGEEGPSGVNTPASLPANICTEQDPQQSPAGLVDLQHIENLQVVESSRQPSSPKSTDVASRGIAADNERASEDMAFDSAMDESSGDDRSMSVDQGEISSADQDEDSAVMQSSESDDHYEPAIDPLSPIRSSPDLAQNEGEAAVPSIRPDVTDQDYEGSVSMSDDGSDVYEPPEPSATGDSEMVRSSSTSPAVPDASSQEVNDGETSNQLMESDTIVNTQNIQPPVQAPSVEPVPSDQTQAGEPMRTSHFRPYESPLKMFRSYRYNPRFTSEVAGGHRSLTYSHNTDPRKHFCIYETAGGTCNDPSCEDQHFRQIQIPDDKILAQMGKYTEETQTPEERDQFVAGLKQVISELRQKGVKDFDLVADELASYRRRFQEQRDPSHAHS